MKDTKKMVRYAVLMALTTVLTMTIQIPTIATNGYLNLGDMVVFIAALTLGKKGGFIVGSFGSAMADILTSYTHYAPITFIVKGLEGYIAGRVLETDIGKKFPVLATAIGGIFMAFGYYIAEVFMYGPIASLASVPGNLVQGLFGALSSIVLYTALKKAGHKEVLSDS